KGLRDSSDSLKTQVATFDGKITQQQAATNAIPDTDPARAQAKQKLVALQTEQAGLQRQKAEVDQQLTDTTTQQEDYRQQKDNVDQSIANARDRINHAQADLDTAQAEEVRLTNDVRTTQA